jgi:D-glycero-D-manno-heptose 1,7-bisphosphate phosphatase
MLRFLTRSVSVAVIVIAPVWGAGCGNAVVDDGAGTSSAHVTQNLEARRQLSYSCPEGSEPIKVAFFDADSTLRVSKKDAVTATSKDDVDVLPFAAKAIRGLNDQGFLVAIVSNQGGVSAGKTRYDVAEGALLLTAAKLGDLGARVNYIDFAEAEDENRKPEPGMARRLDETVKKACGRGIDFAASTMTGDSAYKKGSDGPSPDGRPADDYSNSDRLFAENIGVRFAEPTDAFGWREFGVYNVLGETELVAFLGKIADKAGELRAAGGEADETRARELEDEVLANRKENGLPLPAGASTELR